MTAPSNRIGLLFSVCVVLLVGAALVVQNLRPRSPYFTHERIYDELWEIGTTPRGWPLAYYEDKEAICINTEYLSWDSGAYLPIQQINAPQSDLRHPLTLCLIADIALGLLMLFTTAIVTETWRRFRNGPFQFSMRSMFLATSVVAIIITLVENHWLHWSIVLSPLLALGVVSMPVTIGLAMNQGMRRSDRRLSQLRARFEAK